ncbi:MAG: hypothetical protein ACM3N5_04250 [Candidatus Eiseniibacteriota bacterium]
MPTSPSSGGAAPTYFVELEGAGHLAWTDLVAEHQDSIVSYSIAFFDMVFAGNRGDGLSAKRPDVAEVKAK